MKKKTYNICSATDVGQLRVLGEAHVVEPVKHLVRQHHARARHHLEARNVRHVARRQPVLHKLGHPPRADAQLGRPVPGHQPHQQADVGLERAAVVQERVAALDQRRHARHVHDPARRGVLERHVLRRLPAVQHRLLAAAHEERTDGVDNGLGGARRARRVVHHHGVLEADADKRGRAGVRGAGGEEALPALDPGHRRRVIRGLEAADGNHAFKVAAVGDEALEHARHLATEINGAAIVQGTIVEEDKLVLKRWSANGF